METHSYADMAGLQATNWWYVARRELIRRLIESSGRMFDCVLDYGCGPGSNADALAGDGIELIGLDASEDALAHAKATGKYAQLLRSVDETIPLPDASIDLILAADVLEHVDDKRALTEMYRTLKPGGFLVVTVPAHKWLWNWNDDYSHHLRRYEQNELEQRLTEAGFFIRKISSWNFSLVLPVWLVSLSQRLRKKPERLENNLNTLPAWINGFLLALMRIENRIFLRFGLPIGVSLVAVVERHDKIDSAKEHVGQVIY
ncbi:MAG: class I SAM-dependent methyltransferase [Patescibacteria group bacterium]|mgnify:CR=1 FL=1